MREEQKERALLLGVKLNDGEDFKKSMEELAALSEACGMEVVGTITQNMDRQPHASLYMGRGKLGEVQDYMLEHPVDVLIFDRSLTPSQMRNQMCIRDRHYAAEEEPGYGRADPWKSGSCIRRSDAASDCYERNCAGLQ